MLIHPWDAALDPAEWQDWLASTDRFGMLAVNNLDAAQAPLVLPTHFTLAGEELLVHLARPNPVWPHLEAAGEVRLVDTCERLLGPRRGNATLRRDAERYLNFVSNAQRDWALRVGLVAAGVTVLGVGLSVLISPEAHDQFFWSGVFLSIPLAIWLDLLVPSPPVRASLRFRHLPSLTAIGPMPLERGGGVALGGTF